MWPSGAMPYNYVGEHKVFGVSVLELPDGESEVVDARGMAKLVVVTDTGATASVTRLASDDPTDTLPSGAEADTGPSTKTAIDVDWPYYLVESAGGTTHVGLV